MSVRTNEMKEKALSSPERQNYARTAVRDTIQFTALACYITSSLSRPVVIALDCFARQTFMLM
jgi:hypothetical protein